MIARYKWSNKLFSDSSLKDGDCQECGYKRVQDGDMCKSKDVERLEAENVELKSLRDTLFDKNKALVVDKKNTQSALTTLMKSIPEDVLPKIPDEVKLLCLINIKEYKESLKVFEQQQRRE